MNGLDTVHQTCMRQVELEAVVLAPEPPVVEPPPGPWLLELLLLLPVVFLESLASFFGF